MVVAHPENFELLTAKDVQRVLKVSLPYVYKLAERGQIPCVRIPCLGDSEQARSVVRFRLADVQAFIERYYQGATA
jgi:excisionase family DNA binding protein